MNKSDFTYLLKNPQNVSKEHLGSLSEIIQEFPYLQSARALQLKELNNSKSYKYNTALKTAAAHTIDRSILFQFITSNLFNHEVELEKNVNTTSETRPVTEDFNITEKAEINELEIKEESEIIKELNIGKPIAFISSEPHSFNEWMQLISKKTIDRTESNDEVENELSRDSKSDLIDRFIQQNPKIKPVDKSAKNIDISLESSQEN
jgi:hypothetical protein